MVRRMSRKCGGQLASRSDCRLRPALARKSKVQTLHLLETLNLSVLSDASHPTSGEAFMRRKAAT